MGFLLSVNATCRNSLLRGRKSSGAMCSLSVYSAFIRHPVAQAAFWKAVFIGAFLFMLRGGRSALTALCWIRSIWPRRKTLCVSMCERECVCVCLSWRIGVIRSEWSGMLAGYYCNFRKCSRALPSQLEHKNPALYVLVCLLVSLSKSHPASGISYCLLLSFKSTCVSATVAKKQTNTHAERYPQQT